jgi:hypothetical protein
MRAVGLRHAGRAGSPQFERDNKPSDLNVLRRLERLQAPMQHTEFGAWFVFTAMRSARGTDPSPARLLAFLGNFRRL